MDDTRLRVERAVLEALPPRWRLPARRMHLRLTGRLEPHIRLAPRLIAHGRRAIDVGANRGDWTYALSRCCSAVEAFEPQPVCAGSLAAASLPGVRVHCEGLSDSPGELVLHVPLRGGTTLTQCASVIEPDGPAQRIAIPVRRLDDHAFADVELLKIDVEGHESAVIAGARETLERERPWVLVEIDAALRPDGDPRVAFAQLEEAGYAGWFLHRASLVPVDRFDADAHRTPGSREQARDFIFVPASDAVRRERLVAATS